MFKRILSLTLALAMALSVAGCGASSSAASSEAVSGVVSEAVSEAESTAITLTDQAGRTVTLEQPAETLVSCYYVTTYAAIALGVSDRVVGLEKKAETRPIYQMAAPDLLEKTQVGSLKEFNVEAAAALEPDLVIMPKKLAEHADTLEGLGIPVLVVNPETHEGLVEMLELIAAACGVPERAEALTGYYTERQQALQELTADLEKPVVYMAGNSTYLNTAPDAMYQASLIGLAGGVNAASGLEGDYWTEVSYESLLAMAPEVIIVPCGADYTAADVLADELLAGVPAVQNGAVYQMPSGLEEWDSPVPSGILGAMWLTSVLHPEAYSFETFTADVQSFYQEFYGFTPDAALITK